ncbi:ATPase-like protein [Fulvimarina pelagi HTCC2506]|uniref:ATPase-like protein n=1 Tax=Fulvimarina pelagi HTCC2506 TaxID=314231 RepID=Q0G284_9HYPH|nr:BREX system P-loop protein BrxC [Fulvimarina pelagi]EAU41314.1 ATPase-like protein [Fulvimarina pelagi HTCC2506]
MTSTTIADLFDRPISRQINGVIKADQDDAKSVWQELDEYVITQELDRYMRQFLSAYLAPETLARSGDAACSNGVWVSGFFGSGKSHFIKIISYLLENRAVEQNGTMKTALDFFKSKVVDPMFSADIDRATRIPTDVVLFNVDSKASSNDERAILQVFIRVFNEKLGYCADFPYIADMERFLERKGKYEEFKAAFEKKAGSPWVVERSAIRFHEDALIEAVAEVLGKPRSDAGDWLDKYEANFQPTPENFANWVAEYLARKGPDHRIVFLADEIGAFIGKNGKMMLNLQTITENLGTVCKGGAWVVVTSQANMEAILGEMRHAVEDDFSKIQGRFKARLSLSGSHADEVIQRRILAKKDELKPELKARYDTNGEILRHQVTFRDNRMTLRSYDGEEDFIRHYPFVPYQFQLVQKIFDASRTHGMTGAHLAKGERSMLDAFQTAAILNASKAVGALIPLHFFYPAIESFLEDIVRRAINGVVSNPALEPFDAEVLKTLFLIRYVDEISGNVDNLVTLFLDRIDADRVALRNKITASLKRLESETLVSRNGENFFFLTDEERDIGKEIKAVRLAPGEEKRLLGDLVFDDTLRCVDRGLFNYKVINSDLDVVRFVDGSPRSGPKDKAIPLKIVTPLADDYADFADASITMRSHDEVLVVLDNDNDLARDVYDYLKVEKYATQKMDGTQSESVKRIVRTRQHENSERRKRLNQSMESLIRNARVYVNGRRLDPKATTADAIVGEALDYYIANTFKKIGLLAHLSDDPIRDARVILTTSDDTLDLKDEDPNKAALNEVLDHIGLIERQSKQAVIFDIAEHFNKRPYGWGQRETVLLVVKLFRQGSADILMNSERLDRGQLSSEIDGANKWRKLVIQRRKMLDETTLHGARQLAKDVFGRMPGVGEDAIAEDIRLNLTNWQNDLKTWGALADDGELPGKATVATIQGIIAPIMQKRGSYELIEAFVAAKSELSGVFEDYEDLSDFHSSQKQAWYAMRKAVKEFAINEKEIEKDDAAARALASIKEILTLEAPYSRVREGSALIATVAEANRVLLEKRREHAFGIIDPLIAKIQTELDSVSAEAELRNRSLYPIQNIRKRIETTPSVSAIFMAQTEARDAYDDAFEVIAKAVKLAKERVKTAEPVGIGSQPQTPSGGFSETPVFRPRLVVQPSKLVSAGGYIESQAQVDDFIDRLRARLLEAVSKNERVEIR